MYTAKHLIADLLEINAVALNPKEPFTWASGLKSPIYTDNRLTFAYPDIRVKIAELLAKKIQQAYPEVNVIGGVATAGIPHATSVANLMDLPLNYVRSKPKDHGRGKQIEGRCEEGDKVVLIDDLISTGGSILRTVEAVQKEGVTVIGTASIFSYDLPQAKENFARAQMSTLALVTFPELIEEAKQVGYIDQVELEMLQAWHRAPEQWK